MDRECVSLPRTCQPGEVVGFLHEHLRIERYMYTYAVDPLGGTYMYLSTSTQVLYRTNTAVRLYDLLSILSIRVLRAMSMDLYIEL